MKLKLPENLAYYMHQSNMDSYIYYVFGLKNLFQTLFGPHYPMEIITLIILKLYKPIQIVAGHRYTILISDKTYVWGNNSEGQLGLGDNQHRYLPQGLPLRRIKSISCGEYHTIALTEDAELYIWGRNSMGQLGLGNCTNKNSPQKLILPLFQKETSQINSIVCGSEHTIVLTSGTSTSKIYVWGYNQYGQLGLGDMNNRYAPHELVLENVSSISCGEYHTVALTYHGTLYVWGKNFYGQLGLGDNFDRLLPVKTRLQSNIQSIRCGTDFTIALISSGCLYSWGHNNEGQLGLGDINDRNIPHKIELNNIKLIDCGYSHAVATTATNSMYAWGDNYFGQLGLRNTKDRILPQELILKNIKNINMIVCGGFHTVAIDADDDILVWGLNNCGQLGLDDTTNRNLPCQLKFKFKF